MPQVGRDAQIGQVVEGGAAVGVGARYNLSFGPIRADIAFPLDKREGDSNFQVYVSIGQAF